MTFFLAGKIYAIMTYDDRKWYRARILKINQPIDENNEVTYDALFIDGGWYATNIIIDNIKEIDGIGEYGGPLAMPCSLSELAPCDGAWEQEKIDAFKDFITK